MQSQGRLYASEEDLDDSDVIMLEDEEEDEETQKIYAGEHIPGDAAVRHFLKSKHSLVIVMTNHVQ